FHVPIPNPPGNSRVGPRNLLVAGDSLQRRKVQPAVGGGQEDAKELGAGKVPRQSRRQAPAGLNAITLSENPRPKGTGCLDGLGRRVTSSHRASTVAPWARPISVPCWSNVGYEPRRVRRCYGIRKCKPRRLSLRSAAAPVAPFSSRVTSRLSGKSPLNAQGAIAPLPRTL